MCNQSKIKNVWQEQYLQRSNISVTFFWRNYKQSISHYLTKTTEPHLQNRKVRYIVGANDKTQFSNREEISNSHEEADSLIIHTLDQMKPINWNVIVDATVNYVFFLFLKHCEVILCHSLYISLVCGGIVDITAFNE